MTIASYSDLTTAIGNWLGDTTTYSSRIPEWIVLHEAVLNYGLKDTEHGIDIPPLRSSKGVTRNTSYSISSEFTALPTDFLERKSLALTSTTPRCELVYYNEADFNTRAFSSVSGGSQPRAYTVVADYIRVNPPDATYTAELNYYGTVPTLPSNTTNYVIVNHPNVYLSGVMLQAALFRENDEEIARWLPATISAIRGVNEAHTRQKYSAPLRARSNYTSS